MKLFSSLIHSPYASSLAVTVACGLFYHRNTLYQIAIGCIKTLVSRCFYVDFKKPTQVTTDKAEQRLKSLKARKMMSSELGANINIETAYMSSKATLKTNSVILMCLNTHFYRYMENTDKRIRPYLDSGIDVVLWNPTELTPKVYALNLQIIMSHLYEKNSERAIIVYSYCASSDPSIKAVTEFLRTHNRANVGLICDRGHGNVIELASSMAFLARWPIVKNVLQEHFDCEGENSIASIAGRVLLLSAGKRDQLMQCKDKHLTEALHEKAASSTFYTLENHDHWSDWDVTTFQFVFGWLQRHNLIRDVQLNIESSKYPDPSPPWFKTTILPRLVKLGGC